MDVLLKTYGLLNKYWNLERKKIKINKLYLNNVFTIVLLNDGSVGSACNPYFEGTIKKVGLEKDEKKWINNIKKYPLLENLIKKDDKELNNIELSIKVAIISALSQNFMNKEFLIKKKIILSRPQDKEYLRLSNIIQDGDIVTLIGFGGLLQELLKIPYIKKLYISDFDFAQPRVFKMHMDTMKSFDIKIPLNRIRLSSGKINSELVKKSDVIIFTASTLCNHTLYEILSNVDHCREVIIQGPSASIYPLELFRLGITRIFTTIKKKEILTSIGGRSPEKYDKLDNDYVIIYPFK